MQYDCPHYLILILLFPILDWDITLCWWGVSLSWVIIELRCLRKTLALSLSVQSKVNKHCNFSLMEDLFQKSTAHKLAVHIMPSPYGRRTNISDCIGSNKNLYWASQLNGYLRKWIQYHHNVQYCKFTFFHSWNMCYTILNFRKYSLTTNKRMHVWCMVLHVICIIKNVQKY